MTLHSQVNTSNKRMKKGQAIKNPRNVEEVRGKRRDQKTYMFLGLNIRGKLLLQYPLQPMEVLCFYKSFLQDQQ